MKTKIIRTIYAIFLKRFFFRFDPEHVHNRMLILGSILGRYSLLRTLTQKLFYFQDDILSQTIAGIKFPNPVGLSAGFDKDAMLLEILPPVGFGYMEIGSVTLHAYKGNARPRLYRLPKSKALTVYYGLKNEGVEVILNRVRKRINKNFKVGISIARTNSTQTSELEAGIEDYYQCTKKVLDSKLVDYITINISCPNTFGGEPFTTPQRLEKLLIRLMSLKPRIPVFVKMPIDLSWKEFDSLLKIIIKNKVTGVVIGNLTKERESNLIVDAIPDHIKGGISGMPTQELSDDLIRKTYYHYREELIIIGVGGIFSAEDAYRKIKYGASLVQLITGMIYEGPQLIGEINRDLVKLMYRDGYKTLSQAIGSDLT